MLRGCPRNELAGLVRKPSLSALQAGQREGPHSVLEAMSLEQHPLCTGGLYGALDRALGEVGAGGAGWRLAHDIDRHVSDITAQSGATGFTQALRGWVQSRGQGLGGLRHWWL